MRCASSRAIASPSPEPRDVVAGVEALEDRARASARSIPGPSSVTTSSRVPSAGVCVLDRDRGSLRRVRERVVDQDTHDLRDPVRVGAGGTAAPSAVELELGAVAGRPSARTRRHSARQLAEVDPLAAHLDRVGVELREVEQVGRELRQPLDLLAHRRARTRSRSAGSGSSSSSSSTNPPSEKIGVRSSCEALAMNSLRALSSAREPLLHLVEGASRAGRARRWSRPGSGSRSRRRRPSRRRARAGAGGGRGRRRRGSRRQRGEQRDRPGDQDLAADQRDVVVDVGERRSEKTATQRGLAVVEQRHARSRRCRSPPTRSTALAGAAADQRRRGRRVAGRERGALELGVGDHERRLGPGAPGRTPSSVTAGAAALVDVADQRRAARASEAPSRIAAAEPAALRRRRPARAGSSFSAVRLRAKLRDDVEVDEADRRRGDREEQERRAGCGRCRVSSRPVRRSLRPRRAPSRGSGSRRRAP